MRRILFTLICLVVACAVAYSYRRHRRRHHVPPLPPAPATLVAPQPGIKTKIPLSPDAPPAATAAATASETAKASEEKKH